jgi:hypothetical protein
MSLTGEYSCRTLCYDSNSDYFLVRWSRYKKNAFQWIRSNYYESNPPNKNRCMSWEIFQQSSYYKKYQNIVYQKF